MVTQKWYKTGVILFSFLFFFIWILELDAFARVGGGSSMGSRGSRSYSSPSPSRQSVTQPTPARPATPQMPQQMQQPSMWRSLAMGVAGGFLGSMLFSGLGHAGMGGFGGSGFGLFEIILLGGLLYLLYRYFIKRKQAEAPAGSYYQTGSTPSSESQTPYTAPPYQDQSYSVSDANTGINYIRQMDPSFDENRFTDMCMDSFFKIQGAWANRDMNGVRGILTTEMIGILQRDADKLKMEKKINKLDNIAVRSVEITEAWQEGGMDFITVRLLASLLDYTTSEAGEILLGSKTDPVKFEEYWTFTRPVGNNAWQLSAINQP
jgi:predicted lipid-binding transport protein (Tim44 family)